MDIPRNRIKDYWIDHAIREIASTYGDKVEVKPKGLLKFGMNDGLQATDVYETIWNLGGDETYATGNDIDSVTSSNDLDDVELIIEGHTLSGSELTFVVQSVTLTGNTPATLETPLYRTSRIYNNGAIEFQGDIYVFESGGILTGGVPQTTSDIHLNARAFDQQSQKAATSTSKNDYLIITQWYGSVNRQNVASVDFQLQVRDFGKNFRTRQSGSAHSQGAGINRDLRPYLIVPPNSDIRIRGNSSANSTSADAGFNGVFART